VDRRDTSRAGLLDLLGLDLRSEMLLAGQVAVVQTAARSTMVRLVDFLRVEAVVVQDRPTARPVAMVELEAVVWLLSSSGNP
jgi:hypothetical protein